jgi:hydroxymethylpyrimidine/phosphomethylpyrimidine kinase
VKIGMIGSPEVAEAVAERLSSLSVPIVFDPVMVASSGAALASPETITAFRKLMEVSTVVTPNAPELAALTHLPVGTLEELHQAAIGLARDLDMWVLAKGGHLAGAEVVDVLASSEGRRREFRGSRIDSRHHHGTGCTLASAVRTAMAAAPGFGQGHGPMGHWAATAGAMNLNQVTVGAADYDESVRFYRMLGLRQIVDAPPRYARFECPGGATFSIHVEDGPNTGSETVIYFETANLDDVVQQLSSNGVELRSMPQDQSWLWREARLLDPAGNRICLYWAGENRRFPPWRLAD